MPSYTSNAVGTQRQFTPKPQDSYQARLNDLRFINVQTADYSKGQALATALGLLGTALSKEDTAQEERKKKIADKLAGMLWGSLTSKERKELSAVQIVAQSDPRYGQKGNNYLTATIDRLKGSEQANQAEAEWTMYASQQPHPKSAQEMLAMRDDFIQNYREENEDGLYIDNTTAYNDGFATNQVINAGKAIQQYYTNEEARLRVERFASVDKLAVDSYRGEKGFTPEQASVKNKQICDQAGLLLIANPNENSELMLKMAMAVAKNGGKTALLDLLQQPIGAMGFTVGDYIQDRSGLIELAERRDVLNRTENYVDMEKRVNECNTIAELDSLGESLDGEERETFNKMYAQRKSEIEQEQHRRSRMYANSRQNALLNGNAMIAQSALLNAIEQGAVKTFMGFLPTSPKDLEMYGFTPESLFSAIGHRLPYLLSDPTPENINKAQRLLNNKFITSELKKLATDNLIMDIKRGTTSGETGIDFAMNMYNVSPILAQSYYGNEGLTYLETIKTAQGILGGSLEDTVLALKDGFNNLADDPNTIKTTFDTGAKGVELESIKVNNGWEVPLDAVSNTKLRQSIRECSMILYATGRFGTPEDCVKTVSERIGSQYITVNGTAMPVSFLTPLLLELDGYDRNTQMRYADDAFKQAMKDLLFAKHNRTDIESFSYSIPENIGGEITYTDGGDPYHTYTMPIPELLNQAMIYLPKPDKEAFEQQVTKHHEAIERQQLVYEAMDVALEDVEDMID